MARLLLLNGPNLNLLGRREPERYGRETLAEIVGRLEARAQALGHELEAFQSNAEGALIDRLHAEQGACDFVLLNAASLTHTSIGLRDALLGTALPFVELHLSNVHARESFRHRSVLADVAVGLITGFGPRSYDLALEAAHLWLETRAKP